MASEQKPKKMRSWCFTAWDGEPTFDEKKMRYLCFSPEVCPESGKHHLQGFVYFKSQMTLTAVQKYLMKTFGSKKGINLEFTKGTPEENRTYCGGAHYDDGKGKVKEPNPEFKEWGDLPKQGSRTDIDSIKDAIMSGETTADDVCLENPELFHQCGRTLDRIQALALRKKTRNGLWMTKGEWYYGETGAGKSFTAFKDFDVETHYVVSLSQLARGFWTGYKGQEVVIVNEFRGQIGFGELMDLVDCYDKRVDVKCGEPVPFLAKKVIITGPKSPAETYSGIVDKGDSIEQLYRRFDVFQCWKSDGKYETYLEDHGFPRPSGLCGGAVAPPPEPAPPVGGSLEGEGLQTATALSSGGLAGADKECASPMALDDDGVPVPGENPFKVKLSINSGVKLWGQTKLFGCQKGE